MFWKITKCTALLFLSFVIAGLLVLDFLVYENLDPQGAPTSACPSEALTTISNGFGAEASGHVTYCDYPAVYIYIHKAGTAESNANLVLRYSAEQTNVVPKIEWAGTRTLQISTGDVSQVTKKLTAMEDVTISYSIGRQHYSQDAWETEAGRMKLAIVIITLLILCLGYVFRMIVRRPIINGLATQISDS